MGEAIAELGWARETYVVSTKVFWGLTDGVNTQNTLNRKYLLHAIDGSLERLRARLRRPALLPPARPATRRSRRRCGRCPTSSTAGKALYWGTSEWSADEIRAAWEIADRHHLRKPVMEQPQYNLFERRRVEREYARLYEDIGLGLTTWSPLASGLLTGKYLDGVPEGSRATLPGLRVAARTCSPTSGHNAKVRALAGDRRGARLHAVAAGHRLVREEPARVHGHHRRQPRRAGAREHGRPRRAAQAHRRRHGPDQGRPR